MRYAVLGDIHANPQALRAVLRAAEGAGAEAVLCLGDIVGYYAEPDECVALLRQAHALCIAGNHDRAAAGTDADLADFPPLARQAVRWTRDRIGADSRRFLHGLPIFRTLPECVLVHGALHPRPNDSLHLSTEPRVRRSLLALRDAGDAHASLRLGFFGHTHRPACHELRGARLLRHDPRQPLVLRDGGSYLVNPGSVGQPRDGDPRASFALFDSGAGTVTICRVPYDRHTCLEKAAVAGLLTLERPPPSRWQRGAARLLRGLYRVLGP